MEPFFPPVSVFFMVICARRTLSVCVCHKKLKSVFGKLCTVIEMAIVVKSFQLHHFAYRVNVIYPYKAFLTMTFFWQKVILLQELVKTEALLWGSLLTTNTNYAHVNLSSLALHIALLENALYKLHLNTSRYVCTH